MAQRLAPLFRRSYDALRRRIYAEAASSGFPDLRPAHSSVFRNIAAGGSRVVDLAERAGMTKQSMAYLTESLAGLGYVSVEPDPFDRRAKRVRLTDRGAAAVATLTALSEKAENELSALLGAARLEELRATMQEVVAALEKA